RARTSPLPPAPPPRGPLTPNGSAARHPMARLAKAERAMHELRRATAASNSVAAEHVRDTAATAESGSAALRAMAGDVVAMERAAEVAPAQTRPALTAAIARLDAGVADYEAMIAAAVEVISLAGEGVHRGGHDIRDDIRHATDRLRGLAEGLAHFRNDP
ncbi:MAG: hypothetical protein HOQ24_15435, partial [Mycobacteriaceae bacterium]|nr:hypothetical protein [Mycobacteriaceae bacterium]